MLDTKNTTYVFAVTESGHLEHLYYGATIPLNRWEDCTVFREKREFELGNTIVYSKDHPTTLLEDTCLEMSSQGHGDIREPFIELVLPDGSRSLNFLYDSYAIEHKGFAFETLPTAYFEDEKEEYLCIKLTDGDLSVELFYRVFYDCDVITRSARLTNNGDSDIELDRLLSTQIDLPFSGANVTSFHGAWAREMNKSSINLQAGKFVIESRAGCSSSRANPFFMVHAPNTNEVSGSVYGFNLIYSGNHYSAIEVNAYGKTHIVSGIQPNGFRFVLSKGDCFEAPESVMTYSAGGFAGSSNNMHRFVNHHIVRGRWKAKPRPILLNSWEACYFNISENKLLSIAKAGQELGIELFVMDDGWFGQRENDQKALGDWDANSKKLPHGITGLAKKINELGMDFGIWVEPEMISVDSDLYRSHPNWAMAVPGKLHSEGRNQRLLDLANPEVRAYIIKKMSEVFSSANIRYVKWDMNRIFSDVFSPSLPKTRQGETAHRYICGLYHILEALTRSFPYILFEGCASGGNRFDLGMLCYFPQIWASDNTDPLCRAFIQEGYSYGYPLSCISAHVSASPNHQTLRKTPLETRFSVAAFGLLGYECDLRDLKAEQKQQIEAQIKLYKQWREVFQFGQFYRIVSGNIREWIVVSEDQKRAVGLLLQEMVTPNTQSHRFYAKGLNPNWRYKMYNIPAKIDVKQFGSLIDTVTPIHIKQDSLLHSAIAKVVKMSGESDSVTAAGDILMRTGVALSPAFSATGFNDKVRIFPDFAARLYFFECIDSTDSE